MLAILNSKLADYYIRSLGVTRNGGYFEYKPMFIEQLPVPHISTEEQLKFSSLVDEILTNVKKKESIIEIEKSINELVLQLYNLNNEEIRFLESVAIQ